MDKFIIIHSIFFFWMTIFGLLSIILNNILQDKLLKMNNVIKEIHQLSNINNNNIRYKIYCR